MPVAKEEIKENIKLRKPWTVTEKKTSKKMKLKSAMVKKKDEREERWKLWSIVKEKTEEELQGTHKTDISTNSILNNNKIEKEILDPHTHSDQTQNLIAHLFLKLL